MKKAQKKKRSGGSYSKHDPARQVGARRQAKVVGDFLNAGIPDFIMSAMLTVIDQAFHYLKMKRPEGDFTEKNLYPLFRKTEMLNYDEMWLPHERLSYAISEIIKTPGTPPELYNAVADFVADNLVKGDLETFCSYQKGIAALEELLESRTQNSVQPAPSFTAEKGGAE